MSASPNEVQELYRAHSPKDEEPKTTKNFKRTYIACLNCRIRKVKCDLGNFSHPKSRCARCERERRDCVFVELKKRSVLKVREDKSKASNNLDHERPRKDDEPKHFLSMEGAMVFLTNAAGKIAAVDERDNINAQLKHEQLEKAPGFVRKESYSKNEAGPPAQDSEFRRTSMNSSYTSLLNLDAPTPHEANPPLSMVSLIPPYINKPINRNTRLAMPPAENAYSVRPRGSNALDDIDYIGEDGILTQSEAEYLINMFFSTMHPFFPHIPKFLHLPKVLSGYPILLCAILTISSRCHPLATRNADGVAKNIEIHDRLWLYVQRLISQTVWAEASTRSIGTVFAFLLFTEWNPRAIHWRWSDYANKADDATETRAPDSTETGFGNVSGGISGNFGEPAGLGAMRRSYRMAWMLIGSAVRLAQDTGFMELSLKTFLATHTAEINSVMNMSRRSMLGHSLAEVDLDNVDISEEDMEQREDNEYRVLNMLEDEQKRIYGEYELHFTEAQRAQIELLQITSLGHESLYGYKAQLGSLSQRQNLSVLNIMSPMINNWGRKYKKFLVPSNAKITRKYTPEALEDPESPISTQLAALIQNESFILEFNYTKLYIYSLALSPSPKSRKSFKDGKVTLKLDEISKSAKYIEQAFNAANDILSMAHRVHKLQMLRYMPVRWVTRIVKAVAFIVKCYLTITAHKSSGLKAPSLSVDNFDSTVLSLSLISVEEIALSIQKAAITLRDCSPDELHLCTRYSNVLMYLFSEMKTKLKGNVQNEQSNVADESTTQEDNTNNQQFQNGDFTKGPAMGGFEATPIDQAPSNPQFMGDSEVMDWFANNSNIGLDFVGPWTELIEQHLEFQLFSFDDGLSFK